MDSDDEHFDMLEEMDQLTDSLAGHISQSDRRLNSRREDIEQVGMKLSVFKTTYREDMTLDQSRCIDRVLVAIANAGVR